MTNTKARPQPGRKIDLDAAAQKRGYPYVAEVEKLFPDAATVDNYKEFLKACDKSVRLTARPTLCLKYLHRMPVELQRMVNNVVWNRKNERQKG